VKARRVLARVVLAIVAPIVVGAALLWIGLSSEPLARRLIGFGLARTGNQVTIGQVSGRLRGPLLLRRISVHTEAFRATIDSVRLEWSASALLRRRVRIDRLHLDGLHAVLPDSAPTKRDTLPPKRPSLPLDVVFGDVAASDISVDAPGDVKLRKGAIRLAGRAADYRVEAHADASTPAIKSLHLEAEARGNLERFTSLVANADLLDGRLRIAGPVGWWPKIGWDLSLAADRIHPGAALARPEGLPGTLMLRATTAGSLDSTGPAGRLSLATLAGTLRGHPVGGRAELRFADSVYRIDTLALSWGSAALAARGIVGDTLDLHYRMAVPDLGTMLPHTAGRLTSDGTAGGPRAAARIAMRIDGKGLSSGTNRLARLAGRAKLDLAPDGRNDVEVSGDGARIGAQAINHIILTLRGTRRDHQATARVLAPTARAEFALAGGLDGKQWKGRVTTGRVTATRDGDWRLDRPVAVSASDSAASLEQLCFRNQNRAGGRLCAGGDWHGANGWRASGIVERLPLALAAFLLRPGDSLQGTLDGALDASIVGRRLDAHVQLAATHAALDYSDAAKHGRRRVGLDTAALAVRAGPTGVQGTLAVRASDGNHKPVGNLAAQVALPGYRRLGAPLRPQPLTARIDGHIEDLGVVRTFTKAVDSIAGSVKLGLTAAGTVGAPNLDGSLGLTDFALRLPDDRSVAGAIDATVRANVQRDRRLTADLRVVPHGLRVMYLQDSTPRRLVINGNGLEGHAGQDGVRAAIDLGLGDSAGTRLASLTGHLELPRYTSLDLPLRPQPVTLQLAAQVPDLAVAQGLLTHADSLAGSGALELAASGTVGAPRITGKLRLDHLMARLPQAARLTGALAGDFRAAVAADSSLTADLSLIPHGVTVEYAPDSIPHRMTLDSTGLMIRAGRDGVHGSLDLRVKDAGARQLAGLKGQLALPRYTKLGAPIPPQPVAAKLDGTVDDLSIARAFSVEIDSVAGKVTLDATLSGTAGKPEVVGGLRLQNAAANVPRLGLRLREVQLAATGDRAGRLSIDGRLRSGKGTLTLQGRSPVRPTPEDPGRLHLQGDSIEAANTGEIHVLVSPKLDIALTGDSIDAQGEVGIPYAHIELSEIPQTAVPPSDDVVFTDTVAAARAAAQRVTARIRVVLGDSISFKGFNFDATLGGNLLAVAVPDRPATGSGAIVIKKGQYKAYGQDLTISDGLVRFAGGPVNNPGLDIKATRTAEDSVVAGVQIRGTLKVPEVTIFSKPPMDQGRALQYLVLGHPLGEASGAQGNLASKAASSVGLRGGNLLASSVGKGVGLDEAKIETKGDLKEASFVAGKYLSPSLYVSYGIGLFDPVSTLRLRYALSSKWTLQAEQGVATGADLLYKFESGR
jgi:autotransporter translocation and assembly factor TamB